MLRVACCALPQDFLSPNGMALEPQPLLAPADAAAVAEAATALLALVDAEDANSDLRSCLLVRGGPPMMSTRGRTLLGLPRRRIHARRYRYRA